MAQDNPFSLKALFTQSQAQPSTIPTTIQQVTGVNVPGAQVGLSNLARTPGFLNKVKAGWSGLKSSFDSNKDGKVDANGFFNQFTNAGGIAGIALNALSNVQAPNQPAYQAPAYATPYANLMNGFTLDSFLKGPTTIGSNFYNTQQYSPTELLQYMTTGLPDTSNNSWYTGPGAGSMGPVPPAPQAPQQTAPQQGAPVVQPRAPVQSMPVSNWQSAPQMGLADYNALAMKAEAASMLHDPAARTLKDTSISSRFDPMAGHNAFVKKMDMAKYAGELNPGKALEDAQFNEEMARKLASMSQ